MTVAKMFLLRETRLGQDILENVKTSYNGKVAKQRDETQKKADTYRKMLLDAANMFALSMKPTSWKVSQLKAVLKPLKLNDNNAVPNRKAELYKWWLQWWGRTAPSAEDAELVNGAAPLNGSALDVADAKYYGSRIDEDDIGDTMVLNRDTNVYETF